MRETTILVLCLFLSACTPYKMYKSGASLQEQNKDKLYCDQYTMQSIVAKGYTRNVIGQEYEKIVTFENCLELLGYVKIKQ